MKLGIMQPYFLPYVGYFQLIAAVDKFVIYDNIKYTKKGWINRNRMLQNGADKVFSISLLKASDSLDIMNRELSPEFNRQKLLNQFKGCYAKAPYFQEVWPLLEEIILFQDKNLFRYIKNSIDLVCSYLDIKTEIIISSTIPADHSLLSQDRVLSICKAMNAKTYINPEGGKDLYSIGEFASHAIELKFIHTDNIEYSQIGNSFVSSLSIMDVLFFNSSEETKYIINNKFNIYNSSI